MENKYNYYKENYENSKKENEELRNKIEENREKSNKLEDDNIELEKKIQKKTTFIKEKKRRIK